MVSHGSADSGRWNVTAAIAGWMLPGAGHLLIGERQRGVILFGAIHALWVIGLFVGGLGVIDREGQGGWFLAQVLMGPTLLVDYIVAMDHPEVQAIARGYGRMSDKGVLYTALAGMLNLMAMVDVLYREEKGAKEEAKTGDAEVGGQAEGGVEAGAEARGAEAEGASGGERCD